MRLVSVTEFNAKNEIECPFCGLSPKATRITHPHDKKYYELPNHRPTGTRRIKKIDWSNPA